MSNSSKSTNSLQISALSQNKPTNFQLRPSSEQMRGIALELGLTGLRKVNFSGQIVAAGKSDWTLTGKLGATVTQPCVVTLDPVVTRIDTDVARHFLDQMPRIETDAELGEEVEMPDDESIEPLGQSIDLNALLIESLALALPPYPRSADANLDAAVFTEPGKRAMRDHDTLPFAGLAALRDQLTDDNVDAGDDAGDETGTDTD